MEWSLFIKALFNLIRDMEQIALNIISMVDILREISKMGKDMGKYIFFKNIQGKMTWADRRQYEGDFKFDLMDGEGVYISFINQIFTWPDGKRYEGGYKMDLKV